MIIVALIAIAASIAVLWPIYLRRWSWPVLVSIGLLTLALGSLIGVVSKG